MKQKITLLLFIWVLSVWQIQAQTTFQTKGPITPGAVLDTVFDRFGKKYHLNDIRVDTTTRYSPLSRTIQLCSAGYFDLYFETGSGMEGTSQAEQDRRAVICQVFSDVSAFLPSQLQANNQSVRIWVRDINNLTSSPNFLGMATAFYSIPNASSGIVDNEIWKTIHTGFDSYTGICSPLMLTGSSSSGTFFHGVMGFNFGQPGVIDWQTTITTPTITPGNYDLYSVALHEITHALGFASLINVNGNSKFGANFNYYSRYDMFLRKGTTNLITNTGACNILYDYQFNSALSTTVVAPGCTVTPTPSVSTSADITNCTDAVNYFGSTNVPVYTPTCFEPPSSLSHFEDICHVPAGFSTTCTATPTNNNLYYVMSNANGTGDCSVKRYLKPEERSVLCDLGYTVNTTYGSTGNYTYFNYGGTTCPGINVAGQNDGIVGGVYSFIGATSATIGITGILSNDINATTFECLEDITDPTAFLSANTGNTSTTITFSSSVVGSHLLRYVPVSVGGQRGNITYIYVYVMTNNCTPSACDLVNNGGAENGGCGYLTDATLLNCWDAYSGSPDVYKRNCSDPSFDISNDIPTFSGPPNDTYVGFASNNSYTEAFQINLSSPLIPNQNYLLSFWSSESSFGINNHTIHPIQFTTLPNPMPPVNINQPLINMVPAAVNITNNVLVPDDNAWHYFSIPFTFTGTVNHNVLVVYNDALTFPAGRWSYLQMDGISIKPLSQSVFLDLPAIVCNTVTLADLSVYLSSPAPGAVFSGPGVTFSGGLYSFSASTAGIGSHNIICSFTNTLGCQVTIADNITVSNGSSFTVTATANNSVVCQNSTVILTASGASSYTWQPGNVVTNSFTVNPTSSTVYTVIGTVCSNTAQATISITVTPNPTVSVSNRTICAGTSTVLTASGATTYSWNTGATTNTISVSPTTTTIYTVTGTTNGCSNTRTVSVTVNSTPTVAVNNATICSGTSTVLTASGATTYSWNTGATTNTISVSPTTTTIYTVTGTMNGCSNTRTVSVTVRATPTVAVNNVTICPAASATLTASGANTYSWNTGATTNTIVVTPTATTIYTVIGTNTVGCSGTKTVTVTVTPTITATSNQSLICAGQSSTLSASGASTYSWNTGATTSSVVVTPSVTTIYTVTGTTTNSCVSTKTLQILVTGQYCCQTASFTVGASTATNTNYSNTSNGGGTVIDVLGTITFTANSTLTNYKIRMAPTASININTGVTVTFSNCTVFSCTDLWGGVFIKDGVGVPGIVNVIGSRFEDMYMGIVHAGQNGSATGSTNFINVSNSVFNNNYISIQLRNYPRAHAAALRQGLSVTGSTITSQYSTTSPQNNLKSSATYTYAYNNINSINNPYVNFPRGIAGIYLYNLEEIPVILGDSTGAAGTNRLENLDFGVYAENASIKAFNNHFINLTGSTKQYTSMDFPPPPAPAGPDEIGIGINAIITNGSLYWVRVGKVAGTTTPTSGNPFPAGNKFEDCGKGIAITNYVDPFVKGNVFTATTTSVPPMLTPSSLYSYYKAQSGVYIKEIKSNATITNNYVLNHSSGFYTSHNINTSYGLSTFVKVENNLVEAPGTNGFCRQAIQVDQVLSSTNLGTGLLTVKNNTIQNVYNGIKAYNVKGGLQINSNPTINLSAAKMLGVPGVTGTQINNYARTGIYVQTCQDAVVANNPNITSNGTINSSYYTAVKGIWFNASTGTTGQVNCNVISNMGRCMQFSGTSLNKISKNVMNGTGDYQGFVLALNGVIGDQGHTTNTTHDNEWNGFTGGSTQYAETYTENSNTANSNSRFYVKSGSPFQPTQNYSSNGNPYVTLPAWGIDVKSGLPSETCLALRMIGGDNSNTDNGSNAMRMADDTDTSNVGIFEALASDTTFYDVYQNETQYRNHQLVYELISAQSIDTTQTLGEFYEENQKTNYQTIISINDALANADYQTAQTINSSLTANNTIEEYQKRVNELLLKYINYQSQPVDSNATPFTYKAPVFDAVELVELSAIANSCFDKYGSVVTQARVLMNNVSNTLIEFEDNCKPEFNQRKASKTEDKLSNNIWAIISPNPNNGDMRMDYKIGDYAKAEFKLFDVTGKLVSKYDIVSNEGSLPINEQNLNNGIYFYHILVGDKIIKADKIVIIK